MLARVMGVREDADLDPEDALAQLEAEVRKLSATLRVERERAASLRAQLAHSHEGPW